MRALDRPLNPLGEEFGKGTDLLIDARAVQRGQLRPAVFYAYNCPGLPARCQHSVHRKPGHASIPVRLWVNIPNIQWPRTARTQASGSCSRSSNNARIASPTTSHRGGTYRDVRRKMASFRYSASAAAGKFAHPGPNPPKKHSRKVSIKVA